MGSVAYTDTVPVANGGTGNTSADTTPTSGSTKMVTSGGIYNITSQLSNPNLLINGDFQVWQRGTTFTFSKDNKFHYHADRWCLYNTATSVSYTNTNDSTGNGLNVDSLCYISQILERNLEVGKKYTISLQINNSTFITQVITGGEYADYGRIAYLQHNDGKCYIRIKLSNETLNWVKLEQGSIATPFVPRPYAEELAMCRRYYRRERTTVSYRIRSTANSYAFYIPIPIDMRISGTTTLEIVNGRTADGLVNASSIQIAESSSAWSQCYATFNKALDGYQFIVLYSIDSEIY